jgi:UDP-GlcNAc:undecaprenyl-phosphate/decaprenyl-phosphate GlcNAc-1-phosphate transferase
MHLVSTLVLALAAALVVGLLCFRAATLCTRLRLMDVPDARKTHARATPLLGGLALQGAFVPVLVAAALFFVPTDRVVPLLVIAATTIAMSLVGMADDRHSLRPRDRILISFLVFGSAAIVAPGFFNVRVLQFEHPAWELGLGTGWLAVGFTTLCCVGLVNAINMADGKNGLVIGTAMGWLALLATRAPGWLLTPIALLATVLAVLFYFNMRGRLFLGDGGAYGLAAALGLLTIAAYNSPGAHAGHALSAEEIVVLVYLPVVDSFRLTFVRLKRGQSPMAGDRDHFHHWLEAKFAWPSGLYLYWLAALGPPALIFAFA